MDCREELLTRTLIMLDEAGIKDIDKIRNILTLSIADYEISERCTDLAVIDNNNIQLIKLFFATKKVEGGSDATAKNRWYVLKMFSDDLNKPFSDITKFEILKWLAEQQNRVSLASANGYRNTLSSLFAWMHLNGIIETNPMDGIKPIKHPDPIKRSFTPVEVDALKTACSNKTERAIIEVLISSGIRCEELCNLKWVDIDFSTKEIRVIEGKGNKNRITLMDDIAMKYLMEYKMCRQFESEYVFAVRYKGKIKCRTTNSVGQLLKTIAKRANVSEVNPHKFRRTFATTMYKRGLDVRMIQKLLGHSNINTTMIYIDSDIEMLRDAYKRCA